MGPFRVEYDELATLQLLKDADKLDEILLASGYFNLTDHYMHVILQQSLAKYRLLMASPEVLFLLSLHDQHHYGDGSIVIRGCRRWKCLCEILNFAFYKNGRRFGW